MFLFHHRIPSNRLFIPWESPIASGQEHKPFECKKGYSLLDISDKVAKALSTLAPSKEGVCLLVPAYIQAPEWSKK
jgi:hypothetical protein